ncbi:(-)-germacrene D synthase-like protein [Trifolium pratense]|uniref:(-)-germacrene D synthase-like protein n=1 Tax=Trifolium pratense TaxID=57577 RepID=A0A2K3PLI6_TRIPR|nr:(-)-germacrene D synthase-like protein [Trifolium pratense]
MIHKVNNLGWKPKGRENKGRELMAVALAVQHWRPYLGRHFIVTTDQKSLKQLWLQKITTPDQQNWQRNCWEGRLIQEEVHKDKVLLQIIEEIETKTGCKTRHCVHAGGGHSGFYRTYRCLAANVYWIGMKTAVQEYVKSCDICQRQK